MRQLLVFIGRSVHCALDLLFFWRLCSSIASGAAEGMMTMDQSIPALYQAGKISPDTALDHADNPEQLRRCLD